MSCGQEESGSQGAAKEGSGMCSGTGLLRVRVAPFVQTDLGANHHLTLSPFLVPKRSCVRSFCSLGGKPPTKLWGLGREQLSRPSEHM